MAKRELLQEVIEDFKVSKFTRFLSPLQVVYPAMKLTTGIVQSSQQTNLKKLSLHGQKQILFRRSQ